MLFAVYSLTLGTLKIERIIDWPWIAIVFPAFLYALHTFLIIGLYAAVKKVYDLPEITPKSRECCSPLFNSLWFQGVDTDNSPNKIGCLASVFVLLPFCTLLFIYLLSGSVIPAWTLPIPLHLVSLYIFFMPAYMEISFFSCRSYKQLAWQISSISSILLSVFLGLLSAKLYDPGSDLTWLGVIAPLIALEGWILLSPLLLCTCRICCVRYWCCFCICSHFQIFG